MEAEERALRAIGNKVGLETRRLRHSELASPTPARPHLSGQERKTSRDGRGEGSDANRRAFVQADNSCYQDSLPSWHRAGRL